MTQTEYEVAYLAKWGIPAWSQFLREVKADGMTDRQAFHAYTELTATMGKGAGILSTTWGD